MGLFGTEASFLTDIGLILVQLSGIMAFVGHRFIEKQNKPIWHHFTMISSYLLLWVFLTFYVANYLLNGVTYFGGPFEAALFYYPFLIAHIIGAALMGLLTTYFVLSGIKRTKYSEEDEWKRFTFEDEYRKRHARWGKWVFKLWYLTAISGLIVYLMLYVLFEPKKLVII